jgi:hypothetical protein
VVDLDQVADAKKHMLPSVAARYFENRWTTADDGLLRAEEVAACTSAEIDSDRRDPGDIFTIGADYAPLKDRSAIAVVRVGSDEEPHEMVAMWVAGGSTGKTGRLPVSVVEERLQDLHERFRPSSALVDPYEMRRSLERFQWARPYEFTGSSKVKLTGLLLELFRDQGVRIPDDSDLRQELLGLVVKETQYGFRFEDPPNGHDDRVVALALALHGADRTRLDRALATGPQWSAAAHKRPPSLLRCPPHKFLQQVALGREAPR